VVSGPSVPYTIGADDAQLGRRPQALVAGAGRQHRDVAGRKLEDFPRRAAETHLGAAARDAERLVDHGMIVHVRKNAVAPHVAPAVCAECAFDDTLRARPKREIDGAAIDQQRQARIVWDGSVIAKHQRERLGGSARHGHGLDPRGFAPAL